MAAKINGKTISLTVDEFAVCYPDGEVFIVEDEETADEIIQAAAMVGATYTKVTRLVALSEWKECE